MGINFHGVQFFMDFMRSSYPRKFIFLSSYILHYLYTVYFLEICKRNEYSPCTDHDTVDIVLPFDILTGTWNKVCPLIVGSQLNAKLQDRMISDIVCSVEKLTAKKFQSSLAVSYV